MKNNVFVLSAPAGTGKNTIIKKVQEEFTDLIETVSYTTRKKRKVEVDGVDYFFISEEKFKKRIEKGDFLEYVEKFSYYYGTSKSQVEDFIKEKKDVILIIDNQGALKIKNQIKATYIFLMPPSKKELKKRLLSRKTESKEEIDKRLKISELEIKEIDKYDYVVVNESIEESVSAIKAIIKAQKYQFEKGEIKVGFWEKAGEES